MTRLIDADALVITKKIMRLINLMTTQLDVSKTPELHDKIHTIISDNITNAPTVQREVSVFFEDDDKEVLCFDQYKPEHIVVDLDYAKG